MSKNQRRREVETRKELQEHQSKQQAQQHAMQEAFNAQGDLSRGWMREILGLDTLEETLSEETVRKIQSMIHPQWILSQLTEAETHDRIYWMEVQKYKILGEHPPQESRITGDFRGFIYDDSNEALNPLTSEERNAIDQIIKGLQNMVTRSRGGFEREQINTNIARSETQSESDDGDDGAFGGLFSQ